MRYKILGAVIFLMLVGGAAMAVIQLINFGDTGIRTEEKVCSAQCSTNTTTEKFDMLRNYLHSQRDGLNLSRQGELSYCPCSDTTTLRYDIFDNTTQVGVLVYQNGEPNILINRPSGPDQR